MKSDNDKKSAVIPVPSPTLVHRRVQALARRGLSDLDLTSAKGKEDDAEAWLKKGIREAERGLHIRAIARYKRALFLDPLNASAWAHLGISYESLRLLSDSEDSYRRAEEIAPHYISVVRANNAHPQTAGVTGLSDSKPMQLPRVVPHVWTGPDDVAHGYPPGCSFCGESDPTQYGKPCPKRSCSTWYEVLGIPESADENQIETAYHELAKEWNPERLQTTDDILFDAGYSETQMKWFDAAYAVLSDPITRKQYDAELHERRENR